MTNDRFGFGGFTNSPVCGFVIVYIHSVQQFLKVLGDEEFKKCNTRPICGKYVFSWIRKFSYKNMVLFCTKFFYRLENYCLQTSLSWTHYDSFSVPVQNLILESSVDFTTPYHEHLTMILKNLHRIYERRFKSVTQLSHSRPVERTLSSQVQFHFINLKAN